MFLVVIIKRMSYLLIIQKTLPVGTWSAYIMKTISKSLVSYFKIVTKSGVEYSNFEFECRRNHDGGGEESWFPPKFYIKLKNGIKKIKNTDFCAYILVYQSL